jgi:hypothetical protein
LADEIATAASTARAWKLSLSRVYQAVSMPTALHGWRIRVDRALVWEDKCKRLLRRLARVQRSVADLRDYGRDQYIEMIQRPPMPAGDRVASVEQAYLWVEQCLKQR